VQLTGASRLVRLIACVIATFVLSYAAIGAYVRAMRASGRLHPANARSMHTRPVPVGAGVAFVPPVLLAWFLAPPSLSPAEVALIAACAGLTLLSWLDDLVGMPPAPRLAAHALAVGWCLFQLAPDLRAMPWMPLALERLVEAAAWIWFVNLFNFMDGIDGLAGSEAVALALGYVLVAALAGLGDPSAPLALLILAAMSAYLVWNWHPARVFMGDSGSIPMGFLTGWLLLDLALNGMLAAAIILPMYFWADASLTLAKRLMRGQLPYRPHRDHYYQRATLAWGDHRPVVLRVAAFNGLLLALALLSTGFPVLALLLALTGTALFLARLDHLAASR
jgi:UDP-N-acetylmuramyl pentapeptide phosphotransferase/UDP-N-acetylglucosamine-1-phosphate transferase